MHKSGHNNNESQKRMILCCGEALIDMLPTLIDKGKTAYVPHSGGAIFNTSIALGRLGAKAGLLTGLSSDFFGDMLRKTLRESHVNLSHVMISDRPSTLAFVHMINGKTHYDFHDENTAGRMLATSDLSFLPINISTFFFGGISLIAEPCGTTYEALLNHHAPEKVIAIDPNIRPNFIKNEKSYRTRLEHMIAQADIVKFSDEDLFWLFDKLEDLNAIKKDNKKIIEFAQNILEQGPSIVVVTKGVDGALALTKQGHMSVPSIPTMVVDTVGAGDTFNAGFLITLQESRQLSKDALKTIDNDTLTRALEFAVKVASVTIERSGANPPWRNELA